MAMQLPTAAVPRLLDVTPAMLRALKVQAILLDIDNTLSHHDAPIPFDGVVEWTRQMTAEGFRQMIVSNNTKERVTPFAAKFDLPFLWRACKPLPIGYLRAAKALGLPCKEIVIIGDQVYTDVIGANWIGMQSILVEPAEHEDGISFAVRRHFEQGVRRRIAEKGLIWTEQELKG